MKAVIYDRYGPPDVLRLAEVRRPVPGPGEVLVRVKATTVNRTDTQTRRGAPFIGRLISGVPRPRRRILGSELAGVVEAAGASVTEFKAGDEVFGVNAWRLGTHAEFACVREAGALALKPADLSFEEAAAVCDGAILALNCLRPAKLSAGMSILIYGASGSIGTAGVQLSRYFNADVTGVTNTKNIEIVKSLGADRVIDYTREDFTKNGQSYDVIFDAVGKLSFRACRGSLKPGGIYLPTDHVANVILTLWTARIGDKKVVFAIPPRYTKEDVAFLKGLLEKGKYRAVIDRCYSLEEVIQATRYVETQQKTGNVVLTLDRAKGAGVLTV